MVSSSFNLGSRKPLFLTGTVVGLVGLHSLLATTHHPDAAKPLGHSSADASDFVDRKTTTITVDGKSDVNAVTYTYAASKSSPTGSHNELGSTTVTYYTDPVTNARGIEMHLKSEHDKTLVIKLNENTNIHTDPIIFNEDGTPLSNVELEHYTLGEWEKELMWEADRKGTTLCYTKENFDFTFWHEGVEHHIQADSDGRLKVTIGSECECDAPTQGDFEFPGSIPPIEGLAVATGVIGLPAWGISRVVKKVKKNKAARVEAKNKFVIQQQQMEINTLKAQQDFAKLKKPKFMARRCLTSAEESTESVSA